MKTLILTIEEIPSCDDLLPASIYVKCKIFTVQRDYYFLTFMDETS